MCSPPSFASNSLFPRMGWEKLALLASRSGKLPIRHRSHVVFQKDSTQKFAFDPFVLEHVPNFVDVAFVEDVVNRLKERSTEKKGSEQ